MKSMNIILALCGVSWILHWTTDVFPGGILPLALTASFLVMDLFGVFKREKLVPATSDEPELNERQAEFRRKMEEGRASQEPDAVIRIVEPDGSESLIIITPSGDVMIEGNPNPKILEAALQLRSSVSNFGVEAVAEELARQIEKINEAELAEQVQKVKDDLDSKK